MASLSDLSHADTCAHKFCNTLELRANMVAASKIPGKSRGYFCKPCARRLGYESREDRDNRLRAAAAESVMLGELDASRFIQPGVAP